MDAEHWDRLGTLHTRVEQELAKALQQHHGIGLSEYRALARLAEADDGELRMQELADLIGLNQSSVKPAGRPPGVVRPDPARSVPR